MLHNVKKSLLLGKKAIFLIVLEFILSFIVVFEFFKVLGLNFDFENSKIVLGLASDVSNSVVLIIAIILLFAINIVLKKKFPEAHFIQSFFSKGMKKGLKEKAMEVETEPKIFGHVLIELAFVFVIVLTIYAWTEPNVEIIKWEKLGIFPPFTMALNAVVLVLVLYGTYYLYNFTKPYRLDRKFHKRIR